MSFLTDLRSVSDRAMEQLAARFPSLPRPLLAAIGAGDVAAEQLAELREALQQSVPAAGDVRALAGDVPTRAQRAAAEVASSLGRLADQAPARAQELIAGLPAKATEIASSLSSDTVRETVEAYTQLAAVIYGNLAQRGGQSWSKAAGKPSETREKSRTTGRRDGTAALQPGAESSCDAHLDSAVSAGLSAMAAAEGPAVPAADAALPADPTPSADPAPPAESAPPAGPVLSAESPPPAAGQAEGAAEASDQPTRKPRATRRTTPPPS